MYLARNALRFLTESGPRSVPIPCCKCNDHPDLTNQR
jgi:hypothetical protein